MFILSNFGAGKGYPRSIKFSWFLVCLFSDVVHVKVFAYMGLHPKTGKELPQLSQLKVLCKNVHFEQFWGWERVPPQTWSMLRCLRTWAFIPKTGKELPHLSQLKVLCKNVHVEQFWGWERVPPSIKFSWFPVCLFFPDVVHVKVFAYMGFHPKTGKEIPQLSQFKVLCKNVHFEQFWGWVRVPPIHKALLIPGLPFFPDVVHVKVFAYMGFHPKTGKKLPQLSQLKVLCKNVHFEQFWGWERVCPIQKVFLIPGLFFFFPDVVHVKVFAYMGFHPKTGKELPQLFQFKVLCKNVHFEQFWGWDSWFAFFFQQVREFENNITTLEKQHSPPKKRTVRKHE